jgi:hypothetical protein
MNFFIPIFIALIFILFILSSIRIYKENKGCLDFELDPVACDMALLDTKDLTELLNIIIFDIDTITEEILHLYIVINNELEFRKINE